MKILKANAVKVPSQLISEFKIVGLHGEKNVSLKLNSGVKIIVSDNGSGKTTLLNTLHAVLEGNFLKLGWLDFKEIILKFSSGTSVTIVKKEIPNPMEWLKTENPFLDELRRFLDPLNFKELALIVEKSSDEDQFRENMSAANRRALYSTPYTPLQIFRQMREVRNQHQSAKRQTLDLRDKWKTIKKEFPYTIVYMPTYRRVEEDIRTLGLTSKMRHNNRHEESHIFFGMADVQETFNQLTDQIRISTSETFRTVSSKMIDELLEGGISLSGNIDTSRLKDQKAIDLVMKRLGKQLPSNRLIQLNEFINNPNAIDSDARMMLYLLNNFFEIYETQRENDSKIKLFISIANKYLVNKELRYDEVSIKIKMFSTINNEPIDLDKLSSGEKQLISILSRLYLSETNRFAIIIDEPELSLSIEWQRTLLPDLLRSGKCKFLLAATHSPFIFENELEKYTSTILVEATR